MRVPSGLLGAARRGIVIDLVTTRDYVWMLVVAAVLGAVGGFAGDLLVIRKSGQGQIELPHPAGQRKRFFDLGWGANVIVGAVAAVAVLWVLSPMNESTNAAGLTAKSYDLVKLVAVSLIVGTAGASMLKALQDRAQALVQAQQSGAQAHSAVAALDGIDQHLATSSQVEQLAAATGPSSVAGTVRAQLAVAKKMVASLAPAEEAD